ncbi:peptidase M20 [Pseudopedobacter saltans DSM 12145]|uniref:Peptidase M20 n=1 Tax=Pseudopedobacter saltans (strain ATCC 51119 / DSM 12145 / JCM 21818 / CCUG 39354 / LMG 10337 / NBRC 100064 / NCIMB 13643) TaxID=762903 RepID=F0S9E2_PSESL|nr:M20/M25/M40 family metallo-hydrolase [Pseudopedobacter saltans]ADY52492.1 peptidase M20 [Pseudopedobacter saltans DSM 12145]
MKTSLAIVFALLLILICIVLFNTITFKSKQIEADEFEFVDVRKGSIARLQEALRFKTISYDDSTKTDSAEFLRFHSYLASAFPLVFEKTELIKINNLSLLLRWKGKEQGGPLVLMAHQDVVPVEESTLKSWKADPFSGEVIDGYVYGRGAIDDKGSLMAILESVEMLLSENFIPQNDIYLAFGHDEEVTGQNGAKAIVSWFKQKNIIPKMVLDEGGMITNTKVPNLEKTAAVVGIAEKGYLTVKLETSIEGGHSSMPAQNTAIDILADAIVKIKQNPFPSELNGVVNSFMDYVGPELPFTSKMAMANRWLFSPIIRNIYSKTPAGNASIRTTQAFTVFRSGVKENLIPGEAHATINLRTLPNSSEKDILSHLKKVIANDLVKISVGANKTNPQQIANLNDSTFLYLQSTLSSFRKDIVVAPFLMIGATDSRYFGEITPQVFRFVPFTDLEGLHGINERIAIKEYKEGITFYYYFLKNLKFS